MDLKASKLSQPGHCSLLLSKGGYFSSLELKMGVCGSLWEASADGRYKMKSFSKEIAGIAGVCLQGVHLWEGGREVGGVQEVSVSSGLTVYVTYNILWGQNACPVLIVNAVTKSSRL